MDLTHNWERLVGGTTSSRKRVKRKHSILRGGKFKNEVKEIPMKRTPYRLIEGGVL